MIKKEYSSIRITLKELEKLNKIKVDNNLSSFDETIRYLTNNYQKKNEAIKMNNKLNYIDDNIIELKLVINAFLNAVDNTLLEEETFNNKEHEYTIHASQMLKNIKHINKLNRSEK